MTHPTSRLAGLTELTGVEKLWFSGWYDGPITGLAAYRDHEYWFVMVANDSKGGHWDFDPRVYVLHHLTPELLAQEWEAHRAFAAADFPGCLHTPRRPFVAAADREMTAALRDRWPAEREDAYRNAPAVGWFRDTGQIDVPGGDLSSGDASVG
ncbi:hypothetical protein DFJ67_0730 [Asanoa ferruginea]|uniref:Uncharacterized protein n=1 Tax=Asanoa ferruginea TaxID=53367 RepID=A0A3D9ZBI7_9ACTN|nr:hypothetical protein [Asanoa ferruginea]REF94786.1 hypothetical protein DFJ67_0730 [Asanoa ferruginea]GIF45636.1 hypothetical protein Afe04nite_01750 [Asanoa ferruginea]